MELTFADALRALAYAFGAPASMWLGFLYLNDRNRHVAYFLFANAMLNLGWLTSLTLVVNGYSDRDWRMVMTPIIAVNTGLLVGALFVRLRKRRAGKDVLYPC
jgi:hypothetical protein